MAPKKSTALAHATTRDVARPLKVLSPLILDEYRQGVSAGMDHFESCGHMLNEAWNQILDARAFWSWFRRQPFASEPGFSKTNASRYMHYAEEKAKKSTPPGVRSLRAFREQATGKSPGRERTWYEPVKDLVDSARTQRLFQQRLDDEAKERRLQQELAHKLIDIGYKVLSKQYHPDRPGGSREGMARLNRVRKQLKEAV